MPNYGPTARGGGEKKYLLDRTHHARVRYGDSTSRNAWGKLCNMLGRSIYLFLSVAGSVLIVAATIPFEEAGSNLRSWVRGFGLDAFASHVPESADVYGFVIGVLMLSIGIIVLALRNFRNDELVPLMEVAARTLLASRGRPVEAYLRHRTSGQADAIRLTAEAITRTFPMWGRIPGTSIVEEVAPGTHSVYLDDEGALYATDNFVEREQAYIDLHVKRRLARKIVRRFRRMNAPPFEA